MWHPAEVRLCVYCGSNVGASAGFEAVARELGAAMAAVGIGLVYGGGRVGLMGVVADAVLASGGEAIGVMPEHLVRAEIAHGGLTELVVVDSMHARKARMAELADGFVALPGGYGTFEELFEMLTWNQLGLIAKPVVLLDVEGFFEPLLAMLDHAAERGFVRAEHRALARRAATVGAALTMAAEPVGPALPKWTDRAPSDRAPSDRA